MRINFDLGDLEAFAAVAQQLSYKDAAKSLNISPSALSRRIQKLEAALSVRLLARTTREVRLTLAGKQFLARSQELVAGMDEMLLAWKGENPRQAPAVTVASVPSASRTFLPPAIARFNERFPKTHVRILDSTANEVLEAVQRGDADFGINYIGSQDPGLEFVPLVEDDFVLAVRRDHPLAERPAIRWDEIESERIISVWKEAGIRMLMDFELAKARKSIRWFYEVRHVETGLSLVEAGLGVAAVPRSVMTSAFHPDLAAIRLVEPPISRVLGLIRLRNHALRPGARELWDLVPAG